MTARAEIPDRPFLAYTRRRGWVVAVPANKRHDGGPVVAFVRPGGAMLLSHDIIAIADLPPVPEAAL